MSSVRLYKRQIDRFSHGNGAKVIACALRRYRDGELVIGSGSHDKRQAAAARAKKREIERIRKPEAAARFAQLVEWWQSIGGESIARRVSK